VESPEAGGRHHGTAHRPEASTRGLSPGDRVPVPNDNVVLLNYLYEQDSIKRAVSVIKSRASYHEPDVRPFVIGPEGIVLTDRPTTAQLG